MNRNETIAIMGVLRTAYPEYYRDMKKSDAEKTIALWTELLTPYPVEICIFAVKRLIAESKYVPKISEVVERVKEAIAQEGDSAIDAWNVLYKAVCRASVVTQDEFSDLPYEVKRFCGSLSGLRDIGMLDVGTLNTVTRGQFLKQYDGLHRARETLELMPPDVRALAQSIAKPIQERQEVKHLPQTKPPKELPLASPAPVSVSASVKYKPLTESEWNAKKNELAAKLKVVG